VVALEDDRQYLTGTLRLASGVRLRVPANTTLLASLQVRAHSGGGGSVCCWSARWPNPRVLYRAAARALPGAGRRRLVSGAAPQVHAVLGGGARARRRPGSCLGVRRRSRPAFLNCTSLQACENAFTCTPISARRLLPLPGSPRPATRPLRSPATAAGRAGPSWSAWSRRHRRATRARCEFCVLVPPPVRRSRPPLHAARAPQAQRYADPPQTPFSAPHPARRAPHRRAARAQVDVRSLRLENAPRAALEVARSDSVALMGLNVSAGHGAGVVVDGSQHVYIGGSAVDTAGDALLVQASTGARRRLCG